MCGVAPTPSAYNYSGRGSPQAFLRKWSVKTATRCFRYGVHCVQNSKAGLKIGARRVPRWDPPDQPNRRQPRAQDRSGGAEAAIPSCGRPGDPPGEGGESAEELRLADSVFGSTLVPGIFSRNSVAAGLACEDQSDFLAELHGTMILLEAAVACRTPRFAWLVFLSDCQSELRAREPTYNGEGLVLSPHPCGLAALTELRGAGVCIDYSRVPAHGRGAPITWRPPTEVSEIQARSLNDEAGCKAHRCAIVRWQNSLRAAWFAERRVARVRELQRLGTAAAVAEKFHERFSQAYVA